MPENTRTSTRQRPHAAATPPAVPEVFTVAETAEMLHSSVDTIRRMIARGDLVAVRLGTGLRPPIRVPLDSIRAALRPMTTVATFRDGDAA